MSGNTICTENVSTSAKLTTTFGAETVLHPAAEAGFLVGTITAPNVITPGLDQGYHTYTVTCASGKQVTQRFAEDGNFRA